MSKSGKNGKGKDKKAASIADGAAPPGAEGPLSSNDFDRALKPLQAELVAMQQWVASTKAKVCIVFEGRDTAGKGGVIKTITERVSPRVFKVVALPAPTEEEKTQMYMQRYISHLPGGGQVAIFDRSWYNRAGVERVMGFCTEEQTKGFLGIIPTLEKAMVDAGVILLKYWLEVSEEQQTERLQSRIDDPRKIWKLSPLDLKSYGKWYEYSRARDDMFRASDTAWAPWFIANADDKRRVRLNVITHILSQVPYTPLEMPKIKLPKRQEPDGYVDPQLPLRHIPTPF